MNSETEKLSYEELIKALDCCSHTLETNMCGECPAAKYKAGKCDDFVKLQAAEMLKSQDEQIDNYIKTLAKNTNLISKLNVRLKKSRALNKEVRKNAVKEFSEKTRSMITEIYNKYVFEGFDNLSSEEIDAVVNFSDDVTYGLDNLVKEKVGEE